MPNKLIRLMHLLRWILFLLTVCYLDVQADTPLYLTHTHSEKPAIVCAWACV